MKYIIYDKNKCKYGICRGKCKCNNKYIKIPITKLRIINETNTYSSSDTDTQESSSDISSSISTYSYKKQKSKRRSTTRTKRENIINNKQKIIIPVINRERKVEKQERKSNKIMTYVPKYNNKTKHKIPEIIRNKECITDRCKKNNLCKKEEICNNPILNAITKNNTCCDINCYNKVLVFKGKDIGEDMVTDTKTGCVGGKVTEYSVTIKTWIYNKCRIIGFTYCTCEVNVKCFIVKTCSNTYTSTDMNLEEKKWIFPEFIAYNDICLEDIESIEFCVISK